MGRMSDIHIGLVAEERKANWWDKKTPKLSLREKAVAISKQRKEEN